jgi:hypothetical protein
MVAAMAPSTVKAEPHVLTISQMDVVTARARGSDGYRAVRSLLEVQPGW